jgi:hypothetical protein
VLGGGTLGTAATYSPIVPAPGDRWWRLRRNWRNEDWQGKPTYSEKTCPSATLSTTNPTWLIALLAEPLCYKPKVAGSIPDEVTGIFNWPDSSQYFCVTTALSTPSLQTKNSEKKHATETSLCTQNRRSHLLRGYFDIQRSYNGLSYEAIFDWRYNNCLNIKVKIYWPVNTVTTLVIHVRAWNRVRQTIGLLQHAQNVHHYVKRRSHDTIEPRTSPYHVFCILAVQRYTSARSQTILCSRVSSVSTSIWKTLT